MIRYLSIVSILQLSWGSIDCCQIIWFLLIIVGVAARWFEGLGIAIVVITRSKSSLQLNQLLPLSFNSTQQCTIATISCRLIWSNWWFLLLRSRGSRYIFLKSTGAVTILISWIEIKLASFVRLTLVSTTEVSALICVQEKSLFACCRLIAIWISWLLSLMLTVIVVAIFVIV